jgi:hypothetical protein
MMARLDALSQLAGDWVGRKQVLLPGEPPHESSSAASIAPIGADKFVQMAYTWSFDGVANDGVLILGYDPADEVVTAVWLDSWHMGDKIMACQGTTGADGSVDLRGAYAAESGPDWGWRIVLEPAGDSFRMTMYNITPDGDEWLGVEATYTRAAAS